MCIRSVYVFLFPPPNNLFLHYVLILSEIDPKCFCLWGKQTEKMRIAISGRKKNLSSRFFKVPWQQSIQKNFDENSRQRRWLQGRQFVTPIARATESDCTHTSIVASSLSGPLCKNTGLFCPITALHSEDEWERLWHLHVEMKDSG